MDIITVCVDKFCEVDSIAVRSRLQRIQKSPVNDSTVLKQLT